MTPKVTKLWAKLVQSVPNARLLIKAKPFACPNMAAHFRQRLVMEGLEAHRIDLIPLDLATGDHLHKYRLMDISLDPFPYAGTTTTCEALWMGVPCITLRGKCHAHNVGVSLLTTVGLQDWIADDEDHYIRLAQEKAADLSALSSLRSNMRSKMRASRLMDGRGFVFDLEGVYRSLFRRYCTVGPRHIQVTKRTQAAANSSSSPESNETVNKNTKPSLTRERSQERDDDLKEFGTATPTPKMRALVLGASQGKDPLDPLYTPLYTPSRPPLDDL
eukprot:CAMPEP_0198229450 /NCGR_PEP_ID=MMETSP1445-20131203/114131_1 /TAXON_ID=36898 /ORGANISM="Pyramimonas sp., Strain CCMP2087" /LENGTH=273 /DNA_ID=CAMNT_0043909913 /DNA_START=3 /DNA_END=825 /DNA_ORIENTATION=-